MGNFFTLKQNLSFYFRYPLPPILGQNTKRKLLTLQYLHVSQRVSIRTVLVPLTAFKAFLYKSH